MVDILNLALPYFGLIFIGFACGKAKGLPEQGLAWMNFFLLYVSLPALLFGIMSKTPFAELNNPPFLIATHAGHGQRVRPRFGRRSARRTAGNTTAGSSPHPSPYLSEHSLPSSPSLARCGSSRPAGWCFRET
jgi:hypothetical protein